MAADRLERARGCCGRDCAAPAPHPGAGHPLPPGEVGSGAGYPEAPRPAARLLQLAGLPPGPRHPHPRRLLTGRLAARPGRVRGVWSCTVGTRGWLGTRGPGAGAALTARRCCTEASLRPAGPLPRTFPHLSSALTGALNDSFLNEGCGGGKQWKERPSARRSRDRTSTGRKDGGELPEPRAQPVRS